MPTVIFTGTANHEYRFQPGFCGYGFYFCIHTGSQLFVFVPGSHSRLPGAKKGDGVEIGLAFVWSPAGISDHAFARAQPPQAFHDQPFNLKLGQAKRWMNATGIELPKIRKSKPSDRTITEGGENPVFDAWTREIGLHGFWTVGSGNR